MNKEIFLIEQKPVLALDEFLHQYKNLSKINPIKARKIIKNAMQSKSTHLQDLELRWYKALERNHIDYFVYDDMYYLCELWYWWIKYSRKYLLSIRKNPICKNIFTDSKSIIDLGCGIGYTTACLKQLFPESNIFGTNIKGTKQYKFCKEMSKIYNFQIIPNIIEISHQIDLVFASEYFEHILQPIIHLRRIIELLKPKYFIIANSFNTKAIGHFLTYIDFNKTLIPIKYSQTEISKQFNAVLRKAGYVKIQTNLWNNRPSFWKSVN